MIETSADFRPAPGASQGTTEWEREKSTVEILIVEDDPEIGRFFQIKLADPTRTIFVAPTVTRAREILDEHDIALILLDLTLPDADGRSFLRQVRDNQRTATVPIIVVSGRRGPMTKTECFELGADEYFEKPVPLEMLAAAVTAKIKRVAQLARRSRHDGLTGVLNRPAFQEIYSRLQALSRRTRASLALAILDLDRFKAINDQFGHPFGDQVLIRTAQTIAEALRRSDIVCRWGGDEFVLLLPDTDKAGALRALENAGRVLREASVDAAGHPLHLSFSAGVIDVPEGATLEEAVAEADRLLYEVKSEKRKRMESGESKLEPASSEILESSA